MLVGDKLEIDKVDCGPDLPRSLAGRKEIRLDLGSDCSEAVTVHKSEVSEENGHENGAPHGLVNKNFLGNR